MKWTFALLCSVLVACLGAPSDEREDIRVMSIHSSQPSEEKPSILPVRIETPKKRKSTGDVLRHLGMIRVKSPGSHHRKRLASQSRKSHSGDSHMYILKLPPNPYYYDSEPGKGVDLTAHNVNRLPVSFKSNGKPGKIYHWNLPIIKKMVARKSSGKSKNENQVFKPSLWTGDAEPHMKVSFYKPKKPAKQAFHKFFPDNGKPHSLYVIESEKQRPSPVHRIKQ